ncbi:DUF2752 domain-containing protein [Flexibacter flexilis]|nr:DUF2752 domain-containing protein [Flexibacter flexilis]
MLLLKTLPFKLLSYCKENWIPSLVVFYLLISSILQAITSIDIGIPCLWKTLFETSCPSCGLTTSFVCLLRADWLAAWQTNKLIYVVLPAASFYLLQDFWRFCTK